MRKRGACPYGSDEAVEKKEYVLQRLPVTDTYKRGGSIAPVSQQQKEEGAPATSRCALRLQMQGWAYCFCDMSISTSRKW